MTEPNSAADATTRRRYVLYLLSLIVAYPGGMLLALASTMLRWEAGVWAAMVLLACGISMHLGRQLTLHRELRADMGKPAFAAYPQLLQRAFRWRLWGSRINVAAIVVSLPMAALTGRMLIRLEFTWETAAVLGCAVLALSMTAGSQLLNAQARRMSERARDADRRRLAAEARQRQAAA